MKEVSLMVNCGTPVYYDTGHNDGKLKNQRNISEISQMNEYYVKHQTDKNDWISEQAGRNGTTAHG
jgi:hypothetical protein